MTCPECGSRIKHGMVTCPVCGRKIKTATRTDRDYWIGDEHVKEYTIDYGDEDPGLRDKLFDYAAEGVFALVAIAIAVTLYTWWFRHGSGTFDRRSIGDVLNPVASVSFGRFGRAVFQRRR